MERTAYVLGLRPDEFWRLTPAELGLMVDGYQAREERQDYRAALICAVLANIHRDPKQKPKPYEPGDFMPRAAKPQEPQTPEQMLAVVEAWNAALGGKRV